MESPVVTVLVLFAVSYCGFRLFRLLRIPAPALLGSMFVVGLVSILGMPWGVVPEGVSLSLQALIGIMIGTRLSRDNVVILREMFWPAVVVAGGMIGTGLLTGYLLTTITFLDLPTAMLGSVPGGMAEMTFLALSYELDAALVSFMHFFRFIAITVMVPFLAPRMAGRMVDHHMSESAVALEVDPETWGLPLLGSILVGEAGGFLFWWLDIPAGAILGAMVAVGTLRVAGVNLAPLPRKAIVWAQMGLGGVLGVAFRPDLVGHFQEMLVPVLMVTVLLLAAGIGLGILLHRLFGWDTATCLLACAAAGLSQMSIVAMELEADTVKVGLLHMVRIIAILLLLPPLFTVLLR